MNGKKIGVNTSGIDQNIRLGRKVGEFKGGEQGKLEALKAAENNPGSELVYETGYLRYNGDIESARWSVAEIKEEGVLWGADPLSADDADTVELDWRAQLELGVTQKVISFVEGDQAGLTQIPANHLVGIAQDLATPPAALSELAAHPDEAIRHLVASHPSTPPETLIKLARDDSYAVRMAVKQHPQAPTEALRAIAGRTLEGKAVGLEERFIDQDLVVGPKIGDFNPGTQGQLAAMEAARKNPGSELVYRTDDGHWHAAGLKQKGVLWGTDDLSASQRAEIQLDREKLRNELGGADYQHNYMISFVESDHQGLLAHAEADVRYLASSGVTPPPALAQLARHPDPDIRKRVAENTATPPQALIALAHDASQEIRQEVADNRQAPPEALWLLAGDPALVWQVASNPATPPDLLLEIAQKSPVSYELEQLAGNPKAPPAALLKIGPAVFKATALEEYSANRTLYNLAGNPATPPETLAQLANPDAVRVQLAQYLPDQTDKVAQILDYLMGGLRQTLAGNPATPPAVLDGLAGEYAYETAANPSTPPQRLAELASQKNLAHIAAGNPSLPAEVLAELAQSNNPHIQAAVASNPSAPAAALEPLLQHPSSEVRGGVIANPAVPVDALQALKPQDWEVLLQDISWKDKHLAAQKISTPLPTLAALVVDAVKNPYTDITVALAQNRAMPSDSLTRLARHLMSNPPVKEADPSRSEWNWNTQAAIIHALLQNPATPPAIAKQLRQWQQ